MFYTQMYKKDTKNAKKIMVSPCKIGEEILYINIDLSITRCRIWNNTSINVIIIGKTVRDYGKGENYQQT